MNHRFLQTQIYTELARELARVPARARGANGLTQREEIFARYQALGVRPNTFRRWQRTQSGTRRTDAGTMRRRDEMEPVVCEIFKIQCEMSDFEGGRWIASDIAVAEWQRRNKVPPIPNPSPVNGGREEETLRKPGEISVRNYNLWVQKLGLRKERGHTRFQAGWTNQVHQFDVSGSVHLEVVEQLPDGDYLLKRRPPRARLSKKQKTEGMRLWMAGLIDDHSRVLIFRYEVARGESNAWLRQFLNDVWTGIDVRLPLKGLPEILYCDNGPFARAEETSPYLSREMGVGVELKTHEPYRARSGGKIERSWKTVKTRFENAFLSGRSEWLLSEVNRMAVEFALEMAAKPHPFFVQQSRSEVFQAGIPGELRLPADNALQAAFKTHVRLVDGSGIFRLESQSYQLPAEFRSQRVLVFQNANGQIVAECPVSGQRAVAEIWDGPDAFGEFTSYAETEMDRTAKAREAGVWGEAEHPQATPLISPREQGETRATVLPFIAAKQGENKETPFGAADSYKDRYEAIGDAVRQLGIALKGFREGYPGLWAELNELVEKTLARAEIAHWLDGVKGKLSARQEYGGG